MIQQQLSQTSVGKAFEFACVKSFYENLCVNQHIEIIDSDQYDTAFRFYKELSIQEQEKMDLAADAAVRVIKSLEPQLLYPERNVPLFLSLQPDSAGQAGDVRDVLCLRKQNLWEIGISCKHNHFAVKHSRLSAKIDFGNEWFGIPCSSLYFQNIEPIFDELKYFKDASRASGKPMLWNEIENKHLRYYIPLLEIFMAELSLLDANNPGIIPERLIKYLVGRQDFYKVISVERGKYTRVDAINMYGTLNRPSEGKTSIINVPRLRFPHRFYHIGFSPKSNNTIHIVCDEGWEISMRIHNASSRVEPSLKFDVNLISMPNTICSQISPWG